MSSKRTLRSASRSNSETPATGNAVVEEKTTTFKGSIDKFGLETSESSKISSTVVEETEKIKGTTETKDDKKVTAKRKITDVLSYKPGASPVPKKKSSSYAPPSKYAHLKEVPDQLGDGMYCMFIGLNPGIATSQAGHCYANPSNFFWRMMHQGGLTSRLCKPQEDEILPSEFGLGTTNIVSRPTANQAELSLDEMDDGVALLEQKCRTYKPESVCLVGKAIWESVFRAKHGRKMTKTEFKFGWQNEKENMGVDKKNGYPGARIYVVVSTSGLAATYPMEYKLKLWKDLGKWVNERRADKEEGGDSAKTKTEGEASTAAGSADD
ncbi:hypothetical protein H072_7009 [Dactylellina haptotyla CBS 200.50]|uniref:Uracil-DNA glycosylase-like domain-containing protein n=1 Tax=Dactylellina haptotyla (strain CBS 200.50) TaxID=1284197 RepID=S8A8C0_DACHA|nr:hypothetical protein H072_7009 [Dactylellina haptotyla CBS 200.50]